MNNLLINFVEIEEEPFHELDKFVKDTIIHCRNEYDKSTSICIDLGENWIYEFFRVYDDKEVADNKSNIKHLDLKHQNFNIFDVYQILRKRLEQSGFNSFHDNFRKYIQERFDAIYSD